MATLEEKVTLDMHLRELRGCIGFIDGTLINIHKPCQNETHRTWFNG